LSHAIELAKSVFNWPEFDVLCALTLSKVVPRLLLPLQSNGRVLKPCLLHGDCWDGNTATDAQTGEAFVFDACSFYGHNEYDTGNWRAPRHRLSDKSYIRAYKQYFPPSEPAEDWNARNLLYSLTFNIGNAIYVPGSQQGQVLFANMITLCKLFCPEDLRIEMGRLAESATEAEKLQLGDRILKDGSGEGDNNKEEEKEE
jgi:protein-ribulosamine 3-kinase